MHPQRSPPLPCLSDVVSARGATLPTAALLGAELWSVARFAVIVAGARHGRCLTWKAATSPLPARAGSSASSRLPQLRDASFSSTAPPASAPPRISTISARWLPLCDLGRITPDLGFCPQHV